MSLSSPSEPHSTITAHAPSALLHQEWLSKPVWHRLQSLQGLRGLSDILAVLARGDAAWHAWAGAEMPESLPLPELDARVSPLQRVLVVWALREDRAMMAAARCVRATLGERYTEPPPAGLEEVLKESGPSTPIICLLSPGNASGQGVGTRKLHGPWPEPAALAVHQGSWKALKSCA